MKKQLNIPPFKNEDAEREFWSRIDLGEYAQANDFKPAVFPNLKPSSRSVSLRIPEHTLMRLKEQANKLNIPYQSLIKQYIARGVVQ